MCKEVLIPAEDAEAFVLGLLVHLGLSDGDASVSARYLIQTNLWGVDSHGLLRLPIYAKRLASGAVNRRPVPARIGGRGGFEVWDGDAGLGFVVGHHVMNRAIELARTNGIGAIAVRNSNHFGAAGLYIKQATDAGMVALAMTNVIPNLVVPGGAKPITGNNPLAFGAPTGLDFPMILDVSMSAVAGGKLLLAQEKGEKIPFGWATDRDGRPTDDPFVGFKGFLLPLGGHKGFGLSLMIDILCGVLSGGTFQFGLKSMYSAPDAPSETCHTFIAIDPDAFIGQAEMEARLQAMYAEIVKSPMWDPNQRMLLPGELEYEKMLERRRDGLPIQTSLLRDLLDIARDQGYDVPPSILGLIGETAVSVPKS